MFVQSRVAFDVNLSQMSLFQHFILFPCMGSIQHEPLSIMPMYGILFFNAVYDLAVCTLFYIILTRNDVVKLYNIWF